MISVRVRGSTAANFWVGSLGFLVPSTLTKLSPDLASNNTCSLSLSLPASALPQGHRQCHIMLSLKVDLRNSPNGKSTQNTAMHITIVSLRPQLNKSYPQKLPQESKTSVTKPKKKKKQTNNLPPCYLAITIFIIISLEPICLHTLFTWIKNKPIKDVLISQTN